MNVGWRWTEPVTQVKTITEDTTADTKSKTVEAYRPGAIIIEQRERERKKPLGVLYCSDW